LPVKFNEKYRSLGDRTRKFSGVYYELAKHQEGVKPKGEKSK